MINRRIVIGAAFLFTCSTNIQTVHAQPESHLLIPGNEYVAADLPPNAEGNWLTLFKHDEAFLLAELPVSISRFHDPCVDQSPDQQSGRTVRVPDVDAAIVLLRGVDGLTPGLVLGASHATSGYGFSDTLQIGFLSRLLSLRPSQVGDGYRLALHDGPGSTHLLYSTDWADEGSWLLRWAGDINRDGVVDLLLDATHKYSVSTTRLFLSRKTAEGHTYSEVAAFTTTAC